MAAVSWIAASTASLHASTAAFTVTKPTGTTDGDVLVALFASTTNPGPPAVWDLIIDNNGNPYTSRFVKAWVHRCGPSEPASYTLVPAAGTPRSLAGGIHCLRGADFAEPIDDSSLVVNTVAGTSLVIPSVDITRDGAFLLSLAGGHANNTWTPPGSMVEAWDLKTGTPNGVVSESAIEFVAAAGATGSRTFTAVGGSTTNAGILVAVRPPIPWVIGRVEWGD